MAAPSLLTLPIEIQLQIIDLLPFPTVQNLTAVHPHFCSTIDLDAIRTATHSADILHELWLTTRTKPYHQGPKVCCECLRLRPNNKFSPKIRNRRIRYWGASGFCIDCGIKRSGVPDIWCKKCEEVPEVEADCGRFPHGRNCIRIAELEKMGTFRAPDPRVLFFVSDAHWREEDDPVLSWRERWCWMMEGP